MAEEKVKWTFIDRENLPTVKCWYAVGIGFEVEWSPVFRGIYLKILWFELHVGAWRRGA